MPSIVTRTGDDGSTSLLYGQRVPKTHPQVEAVGVCDELNVALGAVKPCLGAEPRDQERRTLIEQIQRNLVALMGEIACAESDRDRYAGSAFEKLSSDDVGRLDQAVVALESRGLKFEGWATPGGTALSSAFEVARTTARRAERRICSLPDQGRTLRPEAGRFVNRLSDLLWLLAREAEQ